MRFSFLLFAARPNPFFPQSAGRLRLLLLFLHHPPGARKKPQQLHCGNCQTSAFNLRRRLKEILPKGVNIREFGLQHGERKENFFQLIQALDKVDARFRISSIEPNLLTDEMIEFIASSQHFLPHFHIPLQIGSNKILRLMRRRYLRELHTGRVARIQSLMPHACVGADIIAGFPGETKEDFLETCLYLAESQLSYLHVFSYSERAHTEAAKMPGRVHSAERSERSQRLHALSEKRRRRLYQQQAGKVLNVLFENDFENDFIHGHSENYVRVGLPANSNFINQIIPVRITSFAPHGAMTGLVAND